MKFVKLVPFLFLIFFYNISFSQVKFSIGPTIGLSLPTSDFSGTTIDYYNGTKYGQSSAVNFGAIFKIKLPVLRIRASVLYASMKNSGNSEPDKPNSFIEVKNGLFMVSAGPEFSFKLPSGSVTPYAGLDLLFTSISGETTFKDVARVASGTFSMSGASRLGLGLGAGVEFKIGKKNALDLGLRYNFINLIGKKFDDLPSDDRIDSYVNLNDDQDPNYAINPDKHPISNSRSISTFQINLAFLFEF